jgi:hypothetical protein
MPTTLWLPGDASGFTVKLGLSSSGLPKEPDLNRAAVAGLRRGRTIVR